MRRHEGHLDSADFSQPAGGSLPTLVWPQHDSEKHIASAIPSVASSHQKWLTTALSLPAGSCRPMALAPGRPSLTASLLRTPHACYSHIAHSPLPQELACRRQLADIPMSHVWPYQEWLDADRACFMSRQYIHSSLFQRLSTRPFLTQAEKVSSTISGCSAFLVSAAAFLWWVCLCWPASASLR